MSGIAIVCNNRAERGPLDSVIRALPEAQVIGLSPMQQRGSPEKVVSFAIWWFNREFEERKPELVILLGDRYETFAAAQAAFFRRIPIAHIHGGETTMGAMDDAMRDSITRMAGRDGLHFCPTAVASDRVNDLLGGGDYSRHVGAPGLDGIHENSARRDRKLILVTYHPETLLPDRGLAQCQAMLAALPLGYETVFCGVNNDPGCDAVRTAILEWTKNHGGRIETGLDHVGYTQLMQSAACVVGNSSAGVIEAPWVGCPSVNIGGRQDGRPMAPSVIIPDADIGLAIRQAVAYNGPFAPVYKGGAAVKIAKVVREFVGERAAV